MLSQHRHAFAHLIFAFDAMALCTGLLVGSAAALGEVPELGQAALESCVAVLVWTTLARRFGLYESRRLGGKLEEVWSLLQCVTYSIAAVLLLRGATTGRLACDIGKALIVASSMILCTRLLVRRALATLRQRGLNTRTFLFIGRGRSARALAELVLDNQSYGVRVLGELTFTGEEHLPALAGVRSLGSTEALQDVLHRNAIDEAIIAPSDGVWAAEVKSLLRFCEMVGLSCRLAPDFLGLPLARASLSWLGEVPAYAIKSGFQQTRMLGVKRVVDMVGAAAGLVMLAPILLAIAIAVRITSRGPILFRQTRAGLNGRLFVMFKFRSMVADAEQRRPTLAQANELRGPVFKIRDDPRTTSVGRWLRRYSLDELPQLWNVLKGDMSLVGPRPPLPAEVLQYDWWQRRRLSVRPGLTCLWQVSGRNDDDFKRWMELDLHYIDRWNFGMDMKILARTVREVLKGQGV